MAILNNVEMPQWVNQGRRHVAFSCRTVHTLLAFLCTIPEFGKALQGTRLCPAL